MEPADARNPKAEEDRRRLVVSLCWSLGFHLLVFALLFVLAALDLLTPKPPEEMVKTATDRTEMREIVIDFELEQPPPKPQPSLTFVDVDPADAVEEAPKDAKFYSSVSTRAANPEPGVEMSTPKIDGLQDKVVRTADAPRTEPFPLNPAPPETPKEPERQPEAPETASLPKPEPARPSPPEPKAEPAPEEQPKPRTETAGNTRNQSAPEIAKQEQPKPRMSPPRPRPREEAKAPADPPEQERPRTLAEARERERLAGRKMKQEGGVKRKGRITPDTLGSPFGEYDRRLVNAIQQHWYLLIEQRGISPTSGKVVISFRLHDDGRVSGLKTHGSTVDSLWSLICERAIAGPSPFETWPATMKQITEDDFREIKFTFYYD